MKSKMDDEGVKLELQKFSDSSSSVTSKGLLGCDLAAGIVRLGEDDEQHIALKHRFYTSIQHAAGRCSVVGVHRVLHSSPIGKARRESFRLYSKAVMEKRDGKPNVCNAWFPASMEDLCRVVLHDGFSVPPQFGFSGGLSLYPEHSAIDSVLSCPVDVEGLRHLLFCRAILGNCEEVPPGSRQACPSSIKFDSGVDNLSCPKRYTVWFTNANTHILPLFILTIRLHSLPPSRLQGGAGSETACSSSSSSSSRIGRRRPTSPWLPFSKLISMLSKSLPPNTMCIIRKCHTQFMERKITRQQFIYQIRQLSGDKLLISAIKSFRERTNE